MARVRLVSDAEAADEQRRMFEANVEFHGHIANSVRALAHSPAILQWFVPFGATLQRDGLGCHLDARTRALAMVKVSELNRCQY